MEIPVWTEAVAVGEVHLDAQHRALFEAAGQMLKALQEERTEAGLKETLAFLRRYTLRHFVTEEALLQDAGFPGLLEHRAVHAELTVALLDLEARVNRSCMASEAPNLRAFIQRIVDHILGVDSTYAPFLRPTDPAPSLPPSGLGLFSMGFPSLDEGHASFLAILDRLQDAIQAGRGEVELPDLLDSLQAYSRSHFRREELLMDLVDYPNKLNHVAAHATLMDALKQQASQSRQGGTGLPEKSLGFLKAWLREHIGGEDLALVPFLHSLNRI